MIGAEICKALGFDCERVTRLEMTFTAQEATVVVTLAHLDLDREACTRLVETLRTFELVERSAPSVAPPVAPSAVVDCPDGVEAYRVPTLAERVQWLKTRDTAALETDSA
jgi:hypothetical protein